MKSNNARRLSIEALEDRLALTIGGTPLGTEFGVNTTTDDDQFFVDVAVNSTGRSVVVWDSVGQDGDGHGIFARVYDSQGVAATGEIPVNNDTDGDQQFPSVGIDANGHFVVTWEGEDNGSSSIFARRFNASGSPLDDAFTVNTTNVNDHFSPAVAVDTAGNFTVVWDSFGSEGDDIFGRRFNASGTPLSDPFPVNTDDTGSQFFPAISVNGSGAVTVVWESQVQDGDGSGIFGRQYDAGGSPLGDQFPVNSIVTGDQVLPDVATDASGAFAVVWQGPGTGGFDVFARRFGDDATPLASEIVVNSTTSSQQIEPRISADESGSFVVAWHAPQSDGDGTGILAKRFAADGAAIGDEFQVNTETANDQSFPVVATTASGSFLAAWESVGQDGNLTGVFAQRFGSQIPEVDLNGPTNPGRDFSSTFVPGGGAVAAVGADLIVADLDSPQLVSASVVITDLQDGNAGIASRRRGRHGDCFQLRPRDWDAFADGSRHP